MSTCVYAQREVFAIHELILQMKNLEHLTEHNTQLQKEAQRLRGDVSLMKRESKLSRKADRTGQDSLVLLNRELQQVQHLLVLKSTANTAYKNCFAKFVVIFLFNCLCSGKQRPEEREPNFDDSAEGGGSRSDATA